MIASAWYPVTQYRLHLGVQDKLYDLVIQIHKTYNIAPDVREKELLEFLDIIDNKEIEKEIESLYGYVPYRWNVDKKFLESKCNEKVEAVACNGCCFIL